MLNRYTNAEQRTGADQDDCEPLTCGITSSCPCDNIFTFCLRPPGTAQDNDSSNCPLGVFTTGTFDNNDDIDFTQITDLMNSSLSNPFTYTREDPWPVSVPVVAITMVS